MHKFSKLSPFVQTLYEDNTSDEAGVSECTVCTVHVYVFMMSRCLESVDQS